MKSYRRSVLGLSSTFFLVGVFGTAQAEAPAEGPPRVRARIAIVDLERAAMQTEDGLRAQAILKKIFEGRQTEINRRQTDLMKQKEDIEKQTKVLPKDALQKRMEDWQKQATDLNATYLDYNKELEKKQHEVLDPVLVKMDGVIKRLAAAEDYDVLLKREAVAWMPSDVDKTDRLTQMYNSGSGTADPAATKSGPSSSVPPMLSPPGSTPKAAPKASTPSK